MITIKKPLSPETHSGCHLHPQNSLCIRQILQFTTFPRLFEDETWIQRRVALTPHNGYRPCGCLTDNHDCECSRQLWLSCLSWPLTQPHEGRHREQHQLWICWVDTFALHTQSSSGEERWCSDPQTKIHLPVTDFCPSDSINDHIDKNIELCQTLSWVLIEWIGHFVQIKHINNKSIVYSFIYLNSWCNRTDLLIEETEGMLSLSQTRSANKRSRISHANIVGFCFL